MLNTGCHKAKLILVFLLISFANSLFAGGFADAFRDFILDEGNSTGKTRNNASVVPPETGHASRCMECHDGSRATGVTLKHADAEMQFNGLSTVNHPVGMNYAYYANRDPATYVSPQSLDQRILLENGDVTCVSCHALKDDSGGYRGGLMKTRLVSSDGFDSSGCSVQKGVLTTGSSITELCLSCHAM